MVLIAGVVPRPRAHALGATACALLSYIALQAATLSNLLRLTAGRISPRRTLDLRHARLWLDCTAATALVALGLLLALLAFVAMLEARPATLD